MIDRLMTRSATAATMRREPILIFSMGKTGTTALHETLEHATGRPVLKAHALTAEGLRERRTRARGLAIVDRPRFLWACEAIGAELARVDDRRWDLISGVRDPIGLAVSDHFYGVRLQAEAGIALRRSTDDLAFHAAEVEEILHRRFLARDWFDAELRAVTGIDVYANPFSPEAGFSCHDAGRFRAIVLRFEDLAARAPTALGEFLGVRPLPAIPHRNVGTGADEDSLYGRFLHGAPLRASLVDRVYDTALARHFYRDDERSVLRARWTGARV